ncbi:MAG: hypothetical protein LW823_06575 [Rickettsiales bacterium]|jgi:surface antigen|nr:hypothetical protein [Rickettsiales bacterium]
MKNRLLVALCICFSTSLASPVFADRYTYYGGSHYYDNHPRHHSWRQRHKHRYHHRPVVVQHTVINHRYDDDDDDRRYHHYQPASYRQVRCTNGYNPLGLLLGGAAGGIVGKQIGKGNGNTAAIITGAVLGSAVGSGAYQQHCEEESFASLPVGTPVRWEDSADDGYYQLTPMRDYRRQGRYCREYQARATVGGRTQDTYGTACLEPDGSWEIVN